MYNTTGAKCLGTARVSQNYDQPKAVRVLEIPDALESCKQDIDRLNDDLNELFKRLSSICRPEPCSPETLKEPSEAPGLLEPILRIRRSIACANQQVRQITSTLMV